MHNGRQLVDGGRREYTQHHTETDAAMISQVPDVTRRNRTIEVDNLLGFQQDSRLAKDDVRNVHLHGARDRDIDGSAGGESQVEVESQVADDKARCGRDVGWGGRGELSLGSLSQKRKGEGGERLHVYGLACFAVFWSVWQVSGWRDATDAVASLYVCEGIQQGLIGKWARACASTACRLRIGRRPDIVQPDLAIRCQYEVSRACNAGIIVLIVEVGRTVTPTGTGRRACTKQTESGRFVGKLPFLIHRSNRKTPFSGHPCTDSVDGFEKCQAYCTRRDRHLDVVLPVLHVSGRVPWVMAVLQKK